MKKIFLLIALCFIAAYTNASPYCTPTFANPCSGFPMTAAIGTLVGSSGSITDASTCTSASYEDMSALSCTLSPGGTYSATLAITSTYYNSMQVQIWIDFNADSTFQTSETVGGGGYFSSAAPVISLTVPSTVSAGTFRMRLVGNYNCCGASTYPTINPCPTTAISYGDARDYTIVIGSPSPVFSVAPASLTSPNTAAGTTSSSMSSLVGGMYLTPATGTATVTAPADFEVCSSSGGTYVNSYTISYSGATISGTSVFIRFVAPSTMGTYSGNVTISGGGATTVNIAVAALSGCNSTPSSTVSYSTATTSCATNSVTVTIPTSAMLPDITGQWQVSPAGSGTWTNIGGATNASYTFPEPASTIDYRCELYCTTAALTGYSAVATVAIDKISGHIGFTSAVPDTLDMKVWLIYHNTSAGTLTAIDSTISCVDGVLPYYEFNGMGTGSYLVKARSLDYTSTMAGASGVIPTYGASTPHWDTAVTIVHTAGATDTMHIDMISGTVPAGPGFIGGYISSGAGKNTSGDVPAVNMIVFLLDATHHVLTYTYTDASGNYSFSGVAYGSYIIYPEDLNYTTTPSALITLTTSAASATGQNFKQHTGAKTITPNMATTIKSVVHMGNDCVLFPNPATSELTINMDENAYSSLNITNNVGTSVLAMQVSKSLTTVNVKDLAPGVYYIRLTGAAGTVVKQFVKM